MLDPLLSNTSDHALAFQTADVFKSIPVLY